jgi:hypothetical protein
MKKLIEFIKWFLCIKPKNKELNDFRKRVKELDDEYFKKLENE